MTRKSFIPTLASMTDKDFDKFSRFIHSNLGIKMPPQKKSMLEARLRKRLRALGMTSFAEYREYFFSDEGMPKEIVSLCDVVTTNKTDFFREPAHFDFLANVALPDLIQRELVGEEAPLKLWSAGCVQRRGALHAVDGAVGVQREPAPSGVFDSRYRSVVAGA